MAKKILIIDSDRYLLRLYNNLLTNLQYQVIIASDGDKGLLLAQEELPDLIILELNLDKENGLEVIKSIRVDKKLSQIKIIVLTNNIEKENIKQALSMGIESYMIKAHHIPSEVVDKIKLCL